MEITKITKITVIILAGGLGTRLKSVVSDSSKPMADVDGLPFLHYIIKKLAFRGVDKIIFAVGDVSEDIFKYFRYSYLGVDLRYSIETKQLGTGGSAKLAIDHLNGYDDYVFVMNGDTYFNVNLRDMKSIQKEKNADVVMALTEMKDSDRYGRVVMHKDKRITKFTEKGYFKKSLINGGLYLIRKDLFKDIKEDSFSIEEMFTNNVNQLKIYGYHSFNEFIDIGTPNDYKKFREKQNE